jgi:hypothetical protein
MLFSMRDERHRAQGALLQKAGRRHKRRGMHPHEIHAARMVIAQARIAPEWLQPKPFRVR